MRKAEDKKGAEEQKEVPEVQAGLGITKSKRNLTGTPVHPPTSTSHRLDVQHKADDGHSNGRGGESHRLQAHGNGIALDTITARQALAWLEPALFSAMYW